MFRDEINSVLTKYLLGKSYQGKVGSKVLQPEIATEISRAGFVAELEDANNELRGEIPVWRSKDTGLIVATKGRRRIDIVVYDPAGELCAFVEIESDLNDLREEGVSKRRGHYDVWSISRNDSGEYFDSYNSVERMAVAAFCIHKQNETGHYPGGSEVVDVLESIASSSQEHQNPSDIPLFLVAGRTRKRDIGILKPRLDSLNAVLLSPQIVS